MKKAKDTGGYHGGKYLGLSNLNSFEIGLEILYGVFSKEEMESPSWASATPTERHLSCHCTVEEVPNSGR